MDTTINRRAGDIVVTFYVDGIAKLVIICRIAITKVNAFGNVGCIIGNVLVGLEQLPASNGIFATIGNVPICHIADTFIAHIDTTIIQYRPAIIYSEFVRGEIRIGGNGNFLAGMGNGNVRAVFEIHGIARRDIGRAAAIGLHIPAFVGSRFYLIELRYVYRIGVVCTCGNILQGNGLVGISADQFDGVGRRCGSIATCVLIFQRRIEFHRGCACGLVSGNIGNRAAPVGEIDGVAVGNEVFCHTIALHIEPGIEHIIDGRSVIAFIGEIRARIVCRIACYIGRIGKVTGDVGKRGRRAG